MAWKMTTQSSCSLLKNKEASWVSDALLVPNISNLQYLRRLKEEEKIFMTQQLEQCVIRILNADDVVVGAGFLVADRLAVTCAHVVRAAGSDRGQPISIQFYASPVQQKAQVLVEGWSPFDSDE